MILADSILEQLLHRLHPELDQRQRPILRPRQDEAKDCQTRDAEHGLPRAEVIG